MSIIGCSSNAAGGAIIPGSSTETPVGAGGTFTGDPVVVTDYAIVFINVYSDVASATDGLVIEQSTDKTNWWFDDKFTIPAATGKTFSVQPSSKWMRVRYTNGPTPQTDFTLDVIYKRQNCKPSTHRIQDPIIEDDDAELVKSVLTAKKDSGDFVNIGATNNDNLRISINEYGDTPAVDAFARLRVSDNFTIFDSKQLHDKQPLFWDEDLGGSATSIHNSVDADVEMTVTANASDYVVRQTKQRFNYQPGKSQLIFMTFQSPQVSGITSRIGYCSSDETTPTDVVNGIFFECDGTLSWNIAKNGSITETITQSNWNVDPLDGTGASGITLDMSATQILIIDFEWLGVGRVRVGFVIDGLIYYVHYFNHSNDSTFDSVYMSTPNLPLRYSIETDGTNGSMLQHICSTVISEGGIDKTGILRSVESGNTLTSGFNVIGTKYALVGIKLKDAYHDVTIIPEEVQVVIGTNDSFKWELHLNPTVAGTFTYNDLTNSSIQFAQGAATNTVTDGVIIGRGMGSTQTRSAGTELQTALRLGSDIAGVEDELVLVIVPLSANLTALGSLNFRELL